MRCLNLHRAKYEAAYRCISGPGNRNRNAEADGVEPAAGCPAESSCRATIANKLAETTAAHDALFAGDRAKRIGFGAFGVVIFAPPVVAPFQHVSVHVVQSPRVRWEGANLHRLAGSGSDFAPC